MVAILAGIKVGLNNSANVKFFDIFECCLDAAVMNDTEMWRQQFCWPGEGYNLITRFVGGAEGYRNIGRRIRITDYQHSADTVSVAV